MICIISQVNLFDTQIPLVNCTKFKVEWNMLPIEKLFNQ